MDVELRELKASDIENAGFRCLEVARGKITYPNGRESAYNIRLSFIGDALYVVAEDIIAERTVTRRLKKAKPLSKSK